jgi:hypothetical protein
MWVGTKDQDQPQRHVYHEPSDGLNNTITMCSLEETNIPKKVLISNMTKGSN